MSKLICFVFTLLCVNTVCSNSYIQEIKRVLGTTSKDRQKIWKKSFYSVSGQQLLRKIDIACAHTLRNQADEAVVLDELTSLLTGLESIEALYAKHAAEQGIAPKLYLLTPEQAPNLSALIARCAATFNLPPPHLIIADDQRFTTAAAGGIGASTAILLLGTGLLSCMNHQELTATISHELAHIAHDHIPNRLLFLLLLTLLFNMLLLSVVIMWARRSGYIAWQWRSMGRLLLLLFLAESAVFIAPLTTWCLQWYSHSCEYDADAAASAHVGDLDSMKSALLRMQECLESSEKQFDAVYADAAQLIATKAAEWPWLQQRLDGIVAEHKIISQAKKRWRNASHPSFEQRRALL